MGGNKEGLSKSSKIDNVQRTGSVKESDVGITAFVCNGGKGFLGVIKHRFRDFLVNEIGLDGKVVHLTELYNDKIETKEVYREANKVSKDKLDSGLAALEELVDKDSAVKVKQILLDCGVLNKLEDSKIGEEAQENEKTVSAVLPSEDDKQKRSKIHQLIREYFGNILVTDTINLDSESKGGSRRLAVRVVLQSATTALESNKRKTDNRGNRGRNKRRKKNNSKVQVDWRSAKSHEEHKPREKKSTYLEFVLYKENVETHYVINKISRFLKDSQCKIFPAGTKDKRAVTVQKVTITNCTPKNVVDVVKLAFKHGNVVVGNFREASKNLRLGSLKGNEFMITLRNVSVEGCVAQDKTSKQHVEKRLKSISSIGFINYFGLQRFGSRATSTHQIGRAVIKADFEDVCKLILKSDSRDKDSVKEAKKLILKSGDLKKALKLLPAYMTAEQAILKSMIENGSKAFEKAFMQIPHQLRTLYTHSYQSYVWNDMVSKRMSVYGSEEPVVGDLVLLPMKDGAHRTSKNSRVKILSENDIAVGKWAIHDVVMPQPGYDVMYPQHDVGKQAYKEFVEADGLSWDALCKKKGNYALPGGYRAIVVRPSNMSYRWIGYNDENEELALTDNDKLQNLSEKKSEENGKLVALQLTFRLPQSSYATMFMRELSKTETDLASLKEAKLT